MQIEQIQQSQEQNNKLSITQTIFSLLNGMIGSLILILPMQYNKNGIIIPTLILLVTAFVSYTLCIITYQTLNQEEQQQDQSVLRLLNTKGYNFFQVFSALSNIMLAVLYYSILCDQTYNIIQFFVDLPTKKNLTFQQFSFQWLNIILILLLFMLLMVKNIQKIVKISQIGVWATWIYIGYIIYLFITATNQGQDQKQYRVVGLSLDYLYGLNIQGYFITVVRQHQHQNRNKEAIKYTFIFTIAIYSIIGILGSYAIQGLKTKETPQTILDYFPKTRFSSLFISLLYGFHLITVLPCYVKVIKQIIITRIRLYNWKKIRQITINIIIVLLSFFCVFFSDILSISLLIQLNGGILNFFIFYFFPVICFIQHLKCHQQYNSRLLSYQNFLRLLMVLGGLLSIYGLVKIFI